MPGMEVAAGPASRGLSRLGAAVGKAGDAVRFGRGAPTHLVDEAGDVIRRLRNSPSANMPSLRPELIGAGATLGGGVAYGIFGDEDPVR
jgi:hypothetical protein